MSKHLSVTMSIDVNPCQNRILPPDWADYEVAEYYKHLYDFDYREGESKAMGLLTTYVLASVFCLMMSNAFEFDLAGGRLSGQKFYFAPIADSGPLAQQAAEEEEEIDNAGFERPAIFGISSSSGTRRLIQEPPLKRAQPPRLIRPPPLKRSLISRDLLSRWSSDEQPGVANALYY